MRFLYYCALIVASYVTPSSHARIIGHFHNDVGKLECSNKDQDDLYPQGFATARMHLAVVGAPTTAQSKSECSYVHKQVTKADLAVILDKHSDWLATHPEQVASALNVDAGPDTRRANLCGADLTDADLSRGELSMANFNRAVLKNADFSMANLMYADLGGADMTGADLSQAHLAFANLEQAQLIDANLNGAHLFETNLRSANLSNAKLENAELRDVDLAGAEMTSAQLAGTIYEPKPGAGPRIEQIGQAVHLSKMKFTASPAALKELREAFRKGGMVRQEREITYAINHARRLKLQQEGIGGKAEGLFSYLFFEATSEWGMSPWRPLRILAYLIIPFAFPYALALRGHGKDGIWRVEKRHVEGQEKADSERLTLGFFLACQTGLYFSLLSAFSIGWHDLNVGSWISKIQPRDYTLHATGWTRTVSGIQSLISVYLLALWAMTYFSRPFD